jgi:hypothetical protein
MAAGSHSRDAERIAGDMAMGRQQVLVILIIPSHERANPGEESKKLTNQEFWADAALELFAEPFDGATAFNTYAGIYRDKVRGVDLKDKPILVESYTEIQRVNDLDTLTELVSFMKRIGRETNQAAVAVVINNVFHEITEY